MFARPFLSLRPLTLATVAALSAIAVSLALAAPASAQFAFGSFATEGDASAGWVNEPNSPLGSTEQQSIGLFVNGTSASDFSDAARAKFVGVAGPAPAVPPSFDFKVFTIGGSGGSARLVVRFSDGGRGELRPLSLSAGDWTHVDGAGTDWDNRGGSCGDLANQTYAQVVACHTGADVTIVEVINDSGWLYNGGFQLLVDNVSYGGTTVSSPPPPVLGETVGLARISGNVIVRYPGRRRHGQIVHLRGSLDAPDRKRDRQPARARAPRVLAGRKEAPARRLQGRHLQGEADEGPRRTHRCDSAWRPVRVLEGHGGDAQAAALTTTRRLWGRGRGRFRTRGRSSSGSVRGTKWLTVDSCEGTLTVVVEGTVVVHNFATGEDIPVHAGDRYFARASA